MRRNWNEKLFNVFKGASGMVVGVLMKSTEHEKVRYRLNLEIAVTIAIHISGAKILCSSYSPGYLRYTRLLLLNK